MSIDSLLTNQMNGGAKIRLSRYLTLRIVIALALFIHIINPSFANAAVYTSPTITTNTDFYLTVQANTSITVSTSGSGDPTLWLFDSNNVQVAYNDDSSGYMSYISYTALNTGPYRLRAGRCCTYDGGFSGTSYTITVNLTGSVSMTASDVTAPTVSSISIAANAGSDATYISGDLITLTIAWSENVNITGTPRVPIQGLSSKHFSYASGTGTTSTTFTYTVASGDNDSDGIAITANTLELNGGTIKDTSNNNANLSHLAVVASVNQKIDTTAPSFVSATVNSGGTQVSLTYSENLSSTTASSSTFSVSVGGLNATISLVTISSSSVTLTISPIIKITETVTVSYTDPSAANDASAVQDIGGNDASSLSATSVTNNSAVKLNQSALSLSSTSMAYGNTLKLIATGGSGTGAISYSVSSGPCSIINTDSLTATSTGTCMVVATKATDTTYLVQNSSAATLTIGSGSTSATITLAAGALVYRQAKEISALASVGGRVTFKANGVVISGCKNKPVSPSNALTATCIYRPSMRNYVSIEVSLIPTDISYLGSVNKIERVQVLNRTGTR
jgi:hypothetical protein